MQHIGVPGDLQAGRRAVAGRERQQPQLVRQLDRRLRRRLVGGHLAVDQHAVAQRQPVVGGGVEERDVEREVEIPGPRAVDADREGVEHLLRRTAGPASTATSVWVGVPKLPSRSSVAPERKKLRQVAFSAP